MPHVPRIGAIFLLTSLGCAQETPSPNADGWVTLFDGQTVTGLRIDGRQTIENGVLTVSERTHVFAPIDYRHAFELQFELRKEPEDWLVIAGGIPGGLLWRGTATGGGLKTPQGAGWLKVTIVGRPTATGWSFATQARDAATGEMVHETLAFEAKAGHLLYLDIGPESQLAIRSAKFKGVTAPFPSLRWYYAGMALAMVLVASFAVWLAWRHLKRKEESHYAHSPC
jgi:hypothetical protein